MLTVQITRAQNGQFIDYYNLNDIRCAEGLADDLLKRHLPGKYKRITGVQISSRKWPVLTLPINYASREMKIITPGIQRSITCLEIG